MDTEYHGDLLDKSTENPLHRLESRPPEYSEVDAPPPRAYPAQNSHLEIPSTTGRENQWTSMEHNANGAENRRPSFDPQEPSTWRGAKWREIKQQWMERHHGPREPKDQSTGRGLFTGLTPDELKAKCQNYGTLLPKGQRRK